MIRVDIFLSGWLCLSKCHAVQMWEFFIFPSVEWQINNIMENMGNYGLWHLIIPVKSNGFKAVFPLHHEGSMFVLVGAVRSDHKK